MSQNKPKRQRNDATKKYVGRRVKRKEAEEQVDDITAKYPKLSQLATGLSPFTDYPLSSKTLKGLDECGYDVPTDVQRDSLPFTLIGHDVVAAAKTGSGKTLAMLIPILEALWRNYWSSECGLGALIISPTRELALQTFTCLNNIGKFHRFSCALLIGGTDLKYERNRLGGINIIVCTPGRLLQHMDENEQLVCDQLLVLALDEADRMLDMGFATQINSIMDNLPLSRQTLLFSATQTKDVKELSRVCTKDPIFVNPHHNSAMATPKGLKQSYMVLPEHQKINMLWSFIVNHKKQKTLVFVTNCKQARFLTEAFRHMRPGLPLMGLWGTMNQVKRVEVFQKYENSKYAVLIATDVASRGLDFSDIDWVVQVDVPSTIEDYIHRVGRTARMNTSGQSILFMNDHQEEKMKQLFTKYNIPIDKQKVNESMIVDARPNLRSVIAQFSELKEFAQRSIVGYIKSVYLMKNKKIFNVDTIDLEALSDAYGLMAAPKVRFLRKRKNDEDEEESTEPKKSKSTDNDFVGINAEDEDEDDDFLKVKEKDVFKVKEGEEEEINLNEIKRKAAPKAKTKIAEARKLLNKGVIVNQVTKFDEEGDAQKSKFKVEPEGPCGLDLEEAKKNMDQQHAEDRKTLKEKKKLQKAKKQKKGKKAKDVDLEFDAEDSESGGDVDLDWLPDPDKPRNFDDEDDEDTIDKPKKTGNKRTIKDDEEMALNLLNPF